MPVRPIDVVVIGLGLGLARRIAASPHDTLLLNVQASCSRFEPAECLGPDLRTEVLLVELSELDEHAIPMIAAASAALHAAAVVVLYRFSPSASSALAYECPRHMAELLLMVGSFARYSAQARMILEAALERLARAEGIPLPPPA